MTEHRYGNGATRDQQKASNSRWQERQRRMRSWVSELADALGVEPHQLTATPAADLVANILSDYRTTDSR